tara:strand:- start:17737 stop:18741 length:1005 start_codon:yes stop_codon:yes gene_type:complete
MINYNIYFLIFSIFIFTICFYNLNKFGKYLNIFDLPDNRRKIHSKPIPKIGGIFFFIIFLVSFIQIFNFANFKETNNLNNLLIPSFFFILGLIDDKFDLSPNYRLFILTIGLVFLIKFFSLPQIELLSIENYGIINVKSFSLFFTILCYLLFLNAFNMIDGINGLAISIFTIYIILFYLVFDFAYSLFLNLFFCCIIFFYFNIKEKIFLGNAGSYLLAGIISSFLISQNMDLENSFFAEEIFLILMIPGIDMLRLFILRISKKKHPFKADKFHIHHLLLLNFKNKYVLFIILNLVFIPTFARFYFNINTLFLIVLTLIVYSFIVIKYYQSNYNS